MNQLEAPPEERRAPARRSSGSRPALPWVLVAVTGLIISVGAGVEIAGQSDGIAAVSGMTSGRSEQTPPGNPTTTAPLAPPSAPGTGSSAESALSPSATPASEPVAASPAPKPEPGSAAPELAEPAVAPPSSIMLGDSSKSIDIVPIGVTDGVLKPPDDPSIVGWWEAGPLPGGPGRAIITGHIDSPKGLGAFAALNDLRPGDRIAVTSTDGVVRQYEVSERLQIEKADLDPQILNRQDVSDLLLVTCIGKFNRRTLSYESNLLIVAKEK